jgi:phage shock protein PspC (stress-responsive transcriptional regulator)
MSTETRKFYRSREGRTLGGVCAGLGEYLDVDPTLVRIGFVAGTLLGWLVAVPAIYLILWIFTPEKPLASQTASVSAG